MAELSAREPSASRFWLHQFRTYFDASASDTVTELGLFYERHRNFLRYEQLMDPQRIEYTNDEWSDVMSAFFSRLAREFGFYQVREWTGRPELVWFRPGVPLQLAVLIHQENEATDAILTKELPILADSGAELNVLLMYPDYPEVDGISTVETATEVWRGRIESTLARLSAKTGFLLVTIGANEWEIPAPWQGFAWNPEARTLEPVA